MAWERDDVSLAFVASVVLYLLPILSSVITSVTDVAITSVNPFTMIPLYASSLKSNATLLLPS